MSRGYTLIELLVVLAVLGALAGMAMPMAEMVAQRERERELKHALWEIRDALDAWHRAVVVGALPRPPGSHGYPPNLMDLAHPQVDRRADQHGQMIRFLRSVPRDPFADPSLPAERTWGLRGYESEAQRPEPGAEVYDVYSRHRGVGLNGVSIAKW